MIRPPLQPLIVVPSPCSEGERRILIVEKRPPGFYAARSLRADMHRRYRALLLAALEQPNPSQALRSALSQAAWKKKRRP